MKTPKIFSVLGIFLILAGSMLAYAIQTAGGVRIQDVRFTGTNGTPMSALLYVPPNATAKTPAPGILAIHGYYNSRETQDGFAIEFARRGYVVLAIDQTGHGYSGASVFSNGFGGPDGLRYLRSLDIVDKDNIGLEGHSMGGWAVVTAAASLPDGYKALVLEGSSTGKPFAPEGSTTFPRNLAVVESQFDEFAQTMWGAPSAKLVTDSPKLKADFGVSDSVVPGKIYGDIDRGTARVLYTPPITHAQDTFSSEAIGYALSWFQRTLKGGIERPSSDQIWIWKEVGTLVAFVGFIVLLLGTFDLLLTLPWFSKLSATAVPSRARRDRGWWLALLLTLIVPAATFLPLVLWFSKVLPPSHYLPQAFATQIAGWALVNGIVAFIVGLSLGRGNTMSRAPVIPSIGIAVLTVATGYIALALADFFFKVDFRFWVVGLKLLDRQRFFEFLIYLVPITAFAVLALRGMLQGLTVKGDSSATAYLFNIFALAFGFVVFIAVEYTPLYLNDRLLNAGQGLYTILSFQIVPLMAVIALIATFTWRRTNSYLPGALICALFVTWYIVAGQAIQGA